MTYEFTIDGYTIPTAEAPARGPIVDIPKKRWIAQDVLGAADPPTILTLVGESSQTWDFESMASETTKDKYLAVYNGEVAVTLKTPQDATGFDVVMTRLEIDYKKPLANSLYMCRFTLVRR